MRRHSAASASADAAASATADDRSSVGLSSVAVEEAVTPHNDEADDARGTVNGAEKDNRGAAAAARSELSAGTRDSGGLSLQNPRSGSDDAESRPPHDAFHSVSLAAPEAVALPPASAAAAATFCGLDLRTLLCAFLLSLVISDLLLGISNAAGPQCTQLSVYVIACGVISTALFIFVAFRERIALMQRSVTLRRVIIAAIAVVWIFAIIFSATAITNLSDGDCPTRLSVRQLALTNVILIYSVSLAAVLGGLLRKGKFKALSKRVGQVSLALVCLAGFIACTANLATSGSARGRPRFHWGLGARSGTCPRTCEEGRRAASAFPMPPRETICFSADGERVDDAFCDPAEKPLKTSWLFAPCVPIVCSDDITAHWALSYEEPLQPINTHCVEDYLYTAKPNPFKGAFQQLGCWNEEPAPGHVGIFGLPANNWVAWEHCPTAYPTGWLGSTHSEFGATTRFSDLQEPFPPPCSQQCTQLKASAVVYAVLFGIVALGLTGALLCAGKRRPAVVTLDEHLQQQRIAHATEAKEAEMELAPSDSSAVDVMPAAGDAVSSAPPPQAPSRRVLYHLTELCTALCQLTVHGSRAVLPWWRHFLLLCACVLVAAATVLAFANMLLLVNSNCRDFIVSASTAAAVCFVCAAVMANVVVVHRNSLKQADINPFEQIGLLRELDEEDEELDQAAAVHESPVAASAA